MEFARWIESHLGEGLMEIVRKKAMSIAKINKHEEKEIGKHYKKEYTKLKEKRESGEVGIIEFESYQ